MVVKGFALQYASLMSIHALHQLTPLDAQLQQTHVCHSSMIKMEKHVQLHAMSFAPMIKYLAKEDLMITDVKNLTHVSLRKVNIL